MTNMHVIKCAAKTNCRICCHYIAVTETQAHITENHSEGMLIISKCAIRLNIKLITTITLGGSEYKRMILETSHKT